ncbi:MAG: 6-bladed beta-propeller [Candidatus Margulisiibacteriota bacterium]
MKKYIVGSVLILGLTVIAIAITAYKQPLQFIQVSSPPTFVKAWGIEGSGNSQFKNPSGIATDSLGNVYVIDSGNYRVEKFSSDGVYQKDWTCGNPGSVTTGITINDNDRIIVTFGDLDPETPGAVGISKTNGQLLNSMALHAKDKTLDEELGYPQGVAAGQGWDVFIATNYHVVKFNSSNFNLIQSWGGKGAGIGKFDQIKGVAVGPKGNVYVVDANNHRIQKFDSNGNYLTKWESKGSGAGQFLEPKGITVDTAGNVYVTDIENDCIQKFDSNCEFITKWGEIGEENGEFDNPHDIAVHSGSIYVADTSNHRIQKFQSYMFSAPLRIIKEHTLTTIKSPTPQPPAPTSTTTLSPVIEPKAPDEQLTPTTSTVLTTTTTRQIRRFQR